MECRFDIYKTNKGNPTHTDASGKVADDSGIFANITFYNDAEMKSMAYQKYLRVNNFESPRLMYRSKYSNQVRSLSRLNA